LLEPPIHVPDYEEVAEGVADMQGLLHWSRDQSGPIEVAKNGSRMTIYRGQLQRFSVSRHRTS
jgi:hypothetical protein